MWSRILEQAAVRNLADLIEDVSATSGTGTASRVLDHTESSWHRGLNLEDRTASVNLARVL